MYHTVSQAAKQPPEAWFHVIAGAANHVTSVWKEHLNTNLQQSLVYC
jgi:hypothetical protein